MKKSLLAFGLSAFIASGIIFPKNTYSYVSKNRKPMPDLSRTEIIESYVIPCNRKRVLIRNHYLGKNKIAISIIRSSKKKSFYHY